MKKKQHNGSMKAQTKPAPNQWGEPITRDLSGVEHLRELRGVKAFDEMPLYVRRVYLDVARCFPGVEVWAVGSRVRGDYVEPGDGIKIRAARKAAGMKPKTESDFDFFVLDSAVQPVCELPPNTERVRARVPKEEMVPIPIFE